LFICIICVIKIDEKNPNLKTIYMEKMKQYLDRAEYIKKTALKAPDTQIAPDPEPPASGDAAVAKRDTKKK